MSDAKAVCAETMLRFGRMDSDMRDLHDKLTALVEHSNNVGAAKISATLYKMIDDVAYLREVGPGIVAALGDSF